MAKNEAVFLAVVRKMNEESRNEGIVIINDDQTQIPYPVEVQAILEEFSDVFPKDLLARLPPQRELDYRIDLILGAEPPHKAPYRMSP